MAHVTTLWQGWTLRDEQGALGAFPVEMPATVQQALMEEGLLSRRPQGLSALTEKWPLVCGWVYQTWFEWDEQDERCLLICSALGGQACVRVNGVAFGPQAASLRLDVTQALVPGKNQLEIGVRAMEGQDTPLGPVEPVQLCFSNYLTLEKSSFAAEEKGIAVNLCLNVYTGGKYTFEYGLTLGDEMVKKITLEERLRPGIRETAHHIELEKTSFFDKDDPEETSYTLRLLVTRREIGCLMAVKNLARLEKSPLRGVGLYPFAGKEAPAQLSLAHALGAQGVYWPGRKENILTGLVSMEGVSVSSCPAALCPPEDMQALAGEMPCWPPREKGVWALTQSALPDEEKLQALFGANVLGDMARASRLTRFWQAEWVRRKAMEARIEGKIFCLARLQDERPRLASDALVDYSGAARPAYDALQQAWAPTALYARLPDSMQAQPGQMVHIPLWVLSDKPGGVTALTATCMDLSGRVISSVTLSAFSGSGDPAGMLTCSLPPEEGVYVVRLTAGGEKDPIQADYILCAGKQKEPLSLLMNLPGAMLREKEGRLTNQGSQAALGVSSGGYRALMPGEDMPCADTYECLNALV